MLVDAVGFLIHHLTAGEKASDLFVCLLLLAESNRGLADTNDPDLDRPVIDLHPSTTRRIY